MNRLISIVGLLLSCIGLTLATPMPTSLDPPEFKAMTLQDPPEFEFKAIEPDYTMVTAQEGYEAIIRNPPAFKEHLRACSKMKGFTPENKCHLLIGSALVDIKGIDEKGIHFITPKLSDTKWFSNKLPIYAEHYNKDDGYTFCGEIFIKRPTKTIV